MRRIDAVVALGCVVLVGALVINQTLGRRSVSDRGACSTRLRWLGIGFAQYSEDNGQKYPWMRSFGGAAQITNVSGYYLSASNYFDAPSLLTCPQDERISAKAWSSFGNSNLSYFVGIGSTPQKPGSVVSGDRNIAWDTAQSPRRFWWNKNLGLHGDCGNTLMSDGSVLSNLDSNWLSEIFNRPENLTNSLLVP